MVCDPFQRLSQQTNEKGTMRVEVGLVVTCPSYSFSLFKPLKGLIVSCLSEQVRLLPTGVKTEDKKVYPKIFSKKVSKCLVCNIKSTTFALANEK